MEIIINENKNEIKKLDDLLNAAKYKYKNKN